MSADRLSDTTPPFEIAGITWRGWIVDSGQQYEWRSDCGRYRAGRNIGAGTHWASCGGPLVGHEYPTLRFAMLSAQITRRRDAA